MLTRFRNIAIINALMALLYLLTNAGIWGRLNAQYPIIGSVHADPFWITFTQRMVFSGGIWVDLPEVISQPNIPYWIFFITIAVNLLFIYRLTKTVKPTNS